MSDADGTLVEAVCEPLETADRQQAKLNVNVSEPLSLGFMFGVGFCLAVTVWAFLLGTLTYVIFAGIMKAGLAYYGS